MFLVAEGLRMLAADPEWCGEVPMPTWGGGSVRGTPYVPNYWWRVPIVFSVLRKKAALSINNRD
eukprot:COSAG01_NODE_4319_length_5136_cov_2.603216_5_plen_64_part_00